MNSTNGPKHLLFEHVSGYELFELRSFEGLGMETYTDYLSLTQVVKHISSLPFSNAEDAVVHINSNHTGNSNISPDLASFFTLNNVTVLFADKHYKQLLEPLGIEYQSAPEIMRGVRTNIHKLTGKPLDIQLLRGAAHTLSRQAIQYNMEREDNLVVAVGFECDELEAEINELSTRMSGLIDWAAPYLKKITNGEEYNKELSKAIKLELDGQRSPVDAENQGNLLDELKIIKNVSSEDLNYVNSLNETILAKRQLLSELKQYLSCKMQLLAPNLSTILGDQLTYKLIHKAGSLTNLALMPASTLQLLGAEKSLFRSLKMRTRTPKYGLLHGSVTIKGRQGRVCRFIATKCSLAARIDAFSKELFNDYGRELKKAIDKRVSMGPNGKLTERSEDLFKRVCKMNDSVRKGGNLASGKSGSSSRLDDIPLKGRRKEEKDKETCNRTVKTGLDTENKQESGKVINTQKHTSECKGAKRKSPYEMTKSAKDKVVEKGFVQKKVKKGGK
ncbi:nucleolar protein 56 [Pancytospora epiphaga]|nr:nucleolar protein 56 [Pancytospora epiphaga]